MCGTGGKVTIMQPMQINTGGSVSEKFKKLAMTIPGAMLGNDKAPKVIESYWMDETGKEKIDKINYGEKATIFVMTENMEVGKSLKISVFEKNGKQIDGKQNKIVYTGTVKADGSAKLKLLETKENWNMQQ